MSSGVDTSSGVPPSYIAAAERADRKKAHAKKVLSDTHMTTTKALNQLSTHGPRYTRPPAFVTELAAVSEMHQHMKRQRSGRRAADTRVRKEAGLGPRDPLPAEFLRARNARRHGASKKVVLERSELSKMITKHKQRERELLGRVQHVKNQRSTQFADAQLRLREKAIIANRKRASMPADESSEDAPPLPQPADDDDGMQNDQPEYDEYAAEPDASSLLPVAHSSKKEHSSSKKERSSCKKERSSAKKEHSSAKKEHSPSKKEHPPSKKPASADAAPTALKKRTVRVRSD